MNNLGTKNLSVPAGRHTAYVVLSIEKQSHDGIATAVATIRDGSATIAKKVLWQFEISDPGKVLRFGIPIQNYSRRTLSIHVQGAAGVRYHRVVQESTPVPVWAMVPWLGDSMRAGQWYATAQPSRAYTLWIDPAFARIRDSSHVPLYNRVQEAFFCVGRVCNLAFRQVPKAQAQFRYNSGTADQVTQLSRNWNAREWFPGQDVGSAYMAIHPNRSDVWIGNQLKTQQGSGPLSRTNAIRFVLNSFFQLLGFGVYHDDRAPIWAAANANFSGPINFPRNNHGDVEGGLAGMDRYEINHLQQRFGMNWLGRWGG